MTMTGSRDRGQAFTLESMIAALLLVTAVLFALQSVVITSDSAGSLDRDVQSEVQQEASDALVTAANHGELSRLVRYWDLSEGDTFADAPDDSNDYVDSDDAQASGYEAETVPIQQLGETLNHTIKEGNQYNMVLAYQGNDSAYTRETQRLVFQGSPGSDVVETSYTVTLTDDQLVTGPDGGSTTLADADASGDAPIPDAHPGPLYNVVEVRVIVW